jgi:hypothetical protein
MNRRGMRDLVASITRKLLAPRAQPIRRTRSATLGVEQLEPRELPAANPVLALGAEAGRLPFVRVLDEQGTLIRSFAAYDASVKAGVRTAVADLNRDGVNDIVTAPGPGSAPLVKVWDGASGSLLNQFWAYDPGFRGGVQVAAGDIGRGEVGVVTAPDQGSSQVRVFNTQGVLRTSWDVFGPSFTGGVRVALGYAANGNAAVFTAAGPGGAPQVKSFEVRSGRELASFTHGLRHDHNGRGVDRGRRPDW